MTIKTTKNYDQRAHEQPTQASEWAARTGVSQVLTSKSGYRANDPEFNSQLSALHMALNDPAGRNTPASRNQSGGGGLRPQRLTGAETDAIYPGWTDRALERAQRSDGGNG